MSDKLKVLQDEPQGTFPKWLHQKMPESDKFFKTEHLIKKYRLNTVCMEAKCPNRGYCYAQKTATFLALGKVCTRACGFCSIQFNRQPPKPDPTEGQRIAHFINELELQHAVITVVARDDLPHQGADLLADILFTVKKKNPATTLEILTSDFLGDEKSIDIILDAPINIFNHNLETVRRLTPRVRHKATYDRSLKVLKYVKKSQKVAFVKSGIMLGLGENSAEVKDTLQDIKDIQVDIVTLGQYLQAERKKIAVKEFIPPALFEQYKLYGESIGIKHLYSGPFVRSSFNAKELFYAITKR